MNKYSSKIFLILFLLILSQLQLKAEDSIVFLNIEKVLNNSKKGSEVIKKLEVLKNNNSNIFDKKRDAIKKKEDNILKQKNILSENEFEKKIISLKKEVDEFNKERNSLILEFEKIKKKELDDFLKLITPLIQKYVSENSVSVVLNQKNIFIGNKKYDITENIIEIVDKNLK